MRVAFARLLFHGAVVGALCAPPGALAGQRAPERHELAEKEARTAQRIFESYRRVRLPHTAPHGGPCTVTIGRLCYWDDNDDPPLPAEPLSIAAARTRLRARLDVAADDAPESDWILAQRVRYALEDADTAAAEALVSRCAPASWWCHALGGLVWHELGDEARSARAFDRALAQMPDTLRCAWLDVGMWLPSGTDRSMRDAPCADRPAVARRLFWLAAPFLTWHAEAVRNEWFARHVMGLVTRGTALANGLTWGNDVLETSLRFGWPVQWAQEDRAGQIDPLHPPIVGMEPRPSWSFVPAARAVGAPPLASPGDWELSGATAPPMRAAVPGVHRIVPLDVQIARFRRGSAQRVVAAFEVRDSVLIDSAAAGVPAMLLASAPDSTLAVARGPAGALRGALTVDAPAESALAAVEVVDSAHGLGARWRGGLLPLPAGALVSDLLIGRAGSAPVPSTLEGALPLAVPTLAVPEGSTLALYWE
ncbi:MAG: hypothetical protein IRY91_01345, partial [Gemmatimonadaceae bacterium]|nr:hypothetical protein [Gemmatimonadaceae bacterium]